MNRPTPNLSLPHILAQTPTWRSMSAGTLLLGMRPTRDDDFVSDVSSEIVADAARGLARVARTLWTPYRECERIIDKLCDNSGTSRRELDLSKLSKDAACIPLQALTAYAASVLDIPAAETPKIEVTRPERQSQSLFRLAWQADTLCRITDSENTLGLGELLFDAADLIQLCRYGVREPTVDRFVRARALQAILSEQLMADIHRGAPRVTALLKSAPNTQSVISSLLAGELRTALEIDFDLVVNMEGIAAADWATVASRRLGLNKDDLLKATPVRRFPSLAVSSAALAGSLKWGLPDNFWQTLPSLTELLYSPRFDPLSRDERTDIPSQIAKIEVALGEVGATCSEIPVRLVTGSETTEHTAEVTVTCSLADKQRGVHMSRLQEVLVESTTKVWADLPTLARTIAAEARDRQKAGSARAAIRTKFFFLAAAPATRTPSLQPAECSATASVSASGETYSIGLKLGVMTACPCTLAYSRLTAARTLKQQLGVSVDDTAALIPPTFTHSQPGHVCLTITSTNSLPPMRALYDAINSTTHLLHSVLKRPDEHELVFRAHDRPQFCEDVARAVGVAAAALCAERDTVDVTVELDESIHPHKAFAHLHLPARRLWQNS
jgi:GTP cyclohydrolase FolE2